MCDLGKKNNSHKYNCEIRHKIRKTWNSAATHIIHIFFCRSALHYNVVMLLAWRAEWPCGVHTSWWSSAGGCQCWVGDVCWEM